MRTFLFAADKDTGCAWRTAAFSTGCTQKKRCRKCTCRINQRFLWQMLCLYEYYITENISCQYEFRITSLIFAVLCIFRCFNVHCAIRKDIRLYYVLWCFFGRMSRERESVNAPTLVPSPHSYPLSFLTATFIRNAPFPVTETSTASFPDRITCYKKAN